MQNFKKLSENQFIGMNDRFPSHLLPPGMFSKIDNAFVENNSIKKRPGNTPVGASLGSFAILGGSPFEPAGGTKRIVVCRNGTSNAQLYMSSNGTTFSAIGSANLTKDLQMNFIQASNKLFGFNGAEVVDYDGTTVTRNRATVPQGKFGVYFHNYLFVSGVSGNPNRLYWSDLGTPTVFTGTNFVDINANDGDAITGLAIFNDELYVFKLNTIWSITGFSGTSFDVSTIAGQNTNSRIFGYGTPSHQSIINTGRNMYYLSFLGDIPHFRDLGITVFAKTIDQGIVSYDLEGTLNGVNKSQLSKTAGFFDGKRVRWAIPNGSSTTNNLVLTFRPDITMRSKLGTHRSWVTATGLTPSQYFASSISGRTKGYYGDATTGGFVYEMDTSVFTDNGVSVSMDVRTRDYMLDSARKAKWKYMYPKIKKGSAGMLNVYARIDQAADFTLQEAISMIGTSPGLGSFILGTSVLGGSLTFKDRVTYAHLVGTMLGLKYTETTSNAAEFYEWDIYTREKGLRDD